jgi:hypothetical protein
VAPVDRASLHEYPPSQRARHFKDSWTTMRTQSIKDLRNRMLRCRRESAFDMKGTPTPMIDTRIASKILDAIARRGPMVRP